MQEVYYNPTSLKATDVSVPSDFGDDNLAITTFIAGGMVGIIGMVTAFVLLPVLPALLATAAYTGLWLWDLFRYFKTDKPVLIDRIISFFGRFRRHRLAKKGWLNTGATSDFGEDSMWYAVDPPVWPGDVRKMMHKIKALSEQAPCERSSEHLIQAKVLYRAYILEVARYSVIANKKKALQEFLDAAAAAQAHSSTAIDLSTQRTLNEQLAEDLRQSGDRLQKAFEALNSHQLNLASIASLAANEKTLFELMNSNPLELEAAPSEPFVTDEMLQDAVKENELTKTYLSRLY